MKFIIVPNTIFLNHFNDVSSEIKNGPQFFASALLPNKKKRYFCTLFPNRRGRETKENRFCPVASGLSPINYNGGANDKISIYV
jgi:hypothetical protein